MNERKIHELLRRYFDGTTTLEEERELQHFFAGGEIPGSLEIYRRLFAFFVAERAIEPPVRKVTARMIRLNRAILTGVAASVAVLLLVGLPNILRHDGYLYYVDGRRIYDKTEAVKFAGNRLQQLAVSMQKARGGMAVIEKVQESNRSLQQFDKISGAFRQMEEIEAKIQEAGIMR